MQNELVIALSKRFFRLRCEFATSLGRQKDSKKVFSRAGVARRKLAVRTFKREGGGSSMACRDTMSASTSRPARMRRNCHLLIHTYRIRKGIDLIARDRDGGCQTSRRGGK